VTPPKSRTQLFKVLKSRTSRRKSLCKAFDSQSAKANRLPAHCASKINSASKISTTQSLSNNSSAADKAQ
jgi:hypothetical protein